MVKVMVGLLMAMLSVSAWADSPPQYRELLRIERNRILIPGLFSEYMAFNPDGTQIAANSGDEDVRIWDIASGEVVQTFASGGTFVSWSPDGRYIATGIRNDGMLLLWDAETGELVGGNETFQGGSSTWSPDSRHFATDAMQIYDVETGQSVRQFGDWGVMPWIVQWSPDGTMIAAIGEWISTTHIQIWSAADGKRLDTYWAWLEGAWSPDSTRFASAMQVREVATGLPVLILPEMKYSITWHPSGAWLTSSGEKRGEIVLWDADTGAQVAVWTFEDCGVAALTWSRDGQRFAVRCQGGEPDYDTDLLIGELIP